MGKIISAGILGNLAYNDDVHVWALEVGQFLACYELLFSGQGNVGADEQTIRNANK
jgi:hypothetical protein